MRDGAGGGAGGVVENGLRGLAGGEEAVGFAGDDEFLVGGDDEDLGAGVAAGEVGLDGRDVVPALI